MTKHKRALAVLVAAACALGVAAAVQASIPDSSGVIHGCYQASALHGLPAGTLRVIDPSKPSGNCASWEMPLNWNQHGPTGAKGPTGARGPTGPTGPSGISLFADVNSNGTLVHGTATSALRLATGVYRLTFGRAVDTCAAVGNAGGFQGFDSSVTGAVANAETNTSTTLNVNMETWAGGVPTPVDTAFRLVVAC
jgi:hypothetical protein